MNIRFDLSKLARVLLDEVGKASAGKNHALIKVLVELIQAKR